MARYAGLCNIKDLSLSGTSPFSNGKFAASKFNLLATRRRFVSKWRKAPVVQRFFLLTRFSIIKFHIIRMSRTCISISAACLFAKVEIATLIIFRRVAAVTGYTVYPPVRKSPQNTAIIQNRTPSTVHKVAGIFYGSEFVFHVLLV